MSFDECDLDSHVSLRDQRHVSSLLFIGNVPSVFSDYRKPTISGKACLLIEPYLPIFPNAHSASIDAEELRLKRRPCTKISTIQLDERRDAMGSKCSHCVK